MINITQESVKNEYQNMIDFREDQNDRERFFCFVKVVRGRVNVIMSEGKFEAEYF